MSGIISPVGEDAYLVQGKESAYEIERDGGQPVSTNDVFTRSITGSAWAFIAYQDTDLVYARNGDVKKISNFDEYHASEYYSEP